MEFEGRRRYPVAFSSLRLFFNLQIDFLRMSWPSCAVGDARGLRSCRFSVLLLLAAITCTATSCARQAKQRAGNWTGLGGFLFRPPVLTQDVRYMYRRGA
jgi:hypothetical protein